jgi:hypothetical protein
VQDVVVDLEMVNQHILAARIDTGVPSAIDDQVDFANRNALKSGRRV